MPQFIYFLALFVKKSNFVFCTNTTFYCKKLHQNRTEGRLYIVQVYRNPEPQMFSLEVGPNVDIAFLTICTAAIDLLQLR
jgi:hypothetical protein